MRVAYDRAFYSIGSGFELCYNFAALMKAKAEEKPLRCRLCRHRPLYMEAIAIADIIVLPNAKSFL